MTDVSSALAALRRPPLLVQAAGHGLRHYQRDRDLPRILAGSGPAKDVAYMTPLPDHGAAALALIEIESDHDLMRRMGHAAYGPARHLAALVGLLAEADMMHRAE